MSKENMQFVIGKAIVDAEFRNALLSNPDQALAAFDLTPDEKNRLKHMDDEAMQALARALNIPAKKPASPARR